MDSYEDCIIFLLAKAYQRGHAELKKRLEPFGLTPLQQLILAALEQEEGPSAGEIGKRLVLDNATLSGTLDRMAEKGLIRKESDPSDKRMLRVRLTPKARALSQSLGQARQESNEEILSRLSLEEKLLLKRLLRDLQV
ncbi:MAG: MarR family transcriptional regulator [Desulfarculus sp.]|jgi:DNA-binding MarR family transcriptional regulator|nr:MAG: MarR family transcriptional regulator [Desulfarculus sp.]